MHFYFSIEFMYLCHLWKISLDGILGHLANANISSSSEYQNCLFSDLTSSEIPQVDTPSCSARELSLAAARLDAHLYWSISSRLDEEPTLTNEASKQPDSGSTNSKVGEATFIVGEMTDIQEQPGLGELNGSVTTDQSESEA